MSINQSRRSVLLKTMAVTTAIVFSKALIASEPQTTSKPIEHKIVITAFKFEPVILKIKAGDSVTWLNKDIVPHTATASDESWDTGMIETNQSKSITFSKNSTFSYFCFYHPTMKAKLEIIVER
ncbi:MAG: cupredoxin family copper-binding protein [Cocleimonas sp.]